MTADPGIPFDNITDSHKGYYIAKNGKAYSSIDIANQLSTAVGYICYTGSVDKYFTKFIAIALTNAHTYAKWYDAFSVVNTFASSNAVTVGTTTYNTNALGNYWDLVSNDTTNPSNSKGGSLIKGWRLPFVTDWRYIFEGLGNGTPSATSPVGVDEQTAYGDGSTLRSAINTACGNTELQTYRFWSSSQLASDSRDAWYYHFNISNFRTESKAGQLSVRAVFAY